MKTKFHDFSKCQNYLVFKMSFADFQNPQKIANFGSFKMSELSGFFFKCHFQIFKIKSKIKKIANFSGFSKCQNYLVFKMSKSPKNCQFFGFSKCQYYIWFNLFGGIRVQNLNFRAKNHVGLGALGFEIS